MEEPPKDNSNDRYIYAQMSQPSSTLLKSKVLNTIKYNSWPSQ